MREVWYGAFANVRSFNLSNACVLEPVDAFRGTKRGSLVDRDDRLPLNDASIHMVAEQFGIPLLESTEELVKRAPILHVEVIAGTRFVFKGETKAEYLVIADSKAKSGFDTSPSSAVLLDKVVSVDVIGPGGEGGGMGVGGVIAAAATGPAAFVAAVSSFSERRRPNNQTLICFQYEPTLAVASLDLTLPSSIAGRKVVDALRQWSSVPVPVE